MFWFNVNQDEKNTQTTEELHKIIVYNINIQIYILHNQFIVSDN